MGRISTYLNELKNRTGYTQQQLSEITHIPSGTLPKYFSAMDDDSANFEIVRKLVVAMDGSLDELAGIAPKQLVINEEKLTEDGYTESEIRAILRWAGSEIARNYQAIVASLEARIAEKDERLAHRTGLMAEEHQRSKDDIAVERRRAQEIILYERKRSQLCLIVAFVSLGLLAGMFICDFLMPTVGWIQR